MSATTVAWWSAAVLGVAYVVFCWWWDRRSTSNPFDGILAVCLIAGALAVVLVLAIAAAVWWAVEHVRWVA